MFRLNLVGSRMFEFLKLGYPESRIAEEISREFGVARETVQADVREFLGHLEALGLVQSQKPETPAAL
jgi:hypothetical protein